MAEVLFGELAGRAGASHEARSAGVAAGATGRQLTEADVGWADLLCVMEGVHARYVQARWPEARGKLRVLGIPDVFVPGDPVLADRLTTIILELLASADDPGARPGPIV